MALPRDIVFGYEARNKILEGIRAICRAVASTLGPNGHNVLIDDGTLRPVITKDGVTVAKKTSFADKYMRIGANLIKDIASRVDLKAGDGTTTATIVSSNYLIKAAQLADQNYDVNEARNGINDATKEAIAYLNKISRKINTSDEIRKVALVSANGDATIADHMTEAFSSVGEGGTVIVRPTNISKSFVEVSTGIHFEKGYENGAFANSKDGTFTISEKKTMILVMRDSPSKWEDIMPFIACCKAANLALAIICPYFETQFQQECYMANERGMFTDFCLINAPGTVVDRNVGYSRQTKDLATLLGTPIYKAEEFPELDPTKLPMANSIVVTQNRTTIDFDIDEENNKDFQELKAQLESVINSADTDGGATPAEVDMAKHRLAEITGGVATVKVGAASRVEKEEKLALYIDALHAVESALKTGVLPGCGVGMLRASKSLTPTTKLQRTKSPSYIAGYNLVRETLKISAKNVIKSKTEDYALIMSKIAANKNPYFGYNARTGKFVRDMYEEGIIDPCLVETYTLELSASEAGAFMCTDTVITNHNDNVSFNDDPEEYAFEEE